MQRDVDGPAGQRHASGQQEGAWADPAPVVQAVTAAVEGVFRQRPQRRGLARLLEADPSLLTLGLPQVPRLVEGLIRALVEGGATGLVLPSCAACGRQRPLTARSPAGGSAVRATTATGSGTAAVSSEADGTSAAEIARGVRGVASACPTRASTRSAKSRDCSPPPRARRVPCWRTR